MSRKKGHPDLSKWGAEGQVAELALNMAARRLKERKSTRAKIKPFILNPAAFVHDLIEFPSDQELAPYQAEVLEEFPSRRRVALIGPHGLGKTAVAAWLILHFILTFEQDVKIPTTASSWRQLTKYLWPEIHLWARRLRWAKLGRGPLTSQELLTLSLRLSSAREAFAVACDDAATIEGAHASHLLYIYDEAKSIPVETWDASEGAFASGDCYAFAASTPGQGHSRFHDICQEKPGYSDWWVRRVSKEEAIAAGRIDKSWVEARAKQWGTNSPIYLQRVEGLIVESGETQLIPCEWLDLAVSRWKQRQDPARGRRRLGVDVGGMGQAETAIAILVGSRLLPLIISGEKDPAEVTAMVAEHADDSTSIAVDILSNGPAVVFGLRSMGHYPRPVNFGDATPFTDRSGELQFANVRAAAYWHLRELLDPTFGATLELPPDDLLIEELSCPRLEFDRWGRIRMEKKNAWIKRLGGRSPDRGDATALACWLEGDWAPGPTFASAIVAMPTRPSLWLGKTKAPHRATRRWSVR